MDTTRSIIFYDDLRGIRLSLPNGLVYYFACCKTAWITEISVMVLSDSLRNLR